MEAGGGLLRPQTLSRSSSTSGSFQKALPSVPDMNHQCSMSSKRTTDRRTHSCSPYLSEYTLLAEYQLLQQQKVSGVYVIPSADSPLVWFGVIFIRQGLYEGGVFRFSLFIPENYPEGDVPSIIFETSVFHPLVDLETGELDVRKGFGNKWRQNVNRIFHVLLYLRRIFYKIETSNPLNPEAAVLYESDQDMFKIRVQACVSTSQRGFFAAPQTSDAHAIVFSPYDPKIHDNVLRDLKSVDKEHFTTEELSKGLSWVRPGTMSIFSKDTL